MLRMFMRQDVAQRLGRLFMSGVVPTAKQLEECRAARKRVAVRSEGGALTAATDTEGYTVVGNTAEICVEGVLSEEPDFWSWTFGIPQTCYEDIRDALALAAADQNVTNVIFSVSSPGGYVDGLFETLAAIEAFQKPMRVIASQACSAAYALAAMAGPIQPAGPASSFGSVGVAQTFYVDPEHQIDVTSTEAPNKRPDVTTPAGKAVVQAELDAYHELFVDAIARGRSNATGKKYTVDQVNGDFGRGGELLTDAAKAAGMIDKAAKVTKRGSGMASAEEAEEALPTPSVVASTDAAPAAPVSKDQPPRITGQTRKTNPMNEEELLAQHPALHAAMIAKGAAQGQATERKRVCAHLKLAKATGARDVAEAAIASGASTMDEDVHADYLAASLGKRETAARQSDSDAAGEALGDAATAPVATKDLGDEVADRIEAQMGKKPSAGDAPAGAAKH
jgi:ClpP class serine protease